MLYEYKNYNKIKEMNSGHINTSKEKKRPNNLEYMMMVHNHCPLITFADQK